MNGAAGWILDLTPSAALWLAQHLIRQGRLELRDTLAGSTDE